jgi:hypothetical protein
MRRVEEVQGKEEVDHETAHSGKDSCTAFYAVVALLAFGMSFVESSGRYHPVDHGIY